MLIVVVEAVINLNNGLSNLLHQIFALDVFSQVSHEHLSGVLKGLVKLFPLVLVSCNYHNIGSLINVPNCKSLSDHILGAYDHYSFPMKVRFSLLSLNRLWFYYLLLWLSLHFNLIQV